MGQEQATEGGEGYQREEEDWHLSLSLGHQDGWVRGTAMSVPIGWIQGQARRELESFLSSSSPETFKFCLGVGLG
jgi:hypothetical protein